MNSIDNKIHLIQIPTASIQANKEVRVNIPQGTNLLWLPPSFVVSPAGGIIPNPSGAVVGIRINQPDAPMLPWGIDGDGVMVYIGDVNQIWVTLLAGDTSPGIALLAATDVGIGYSHAKTIGGVVPAAPSFGASLKRTL